LEDAPQPYAICAIWLLGTILPFAFLTILGLASADPLGATAIVSMVPTRDFSSTHLAHVGEKMSCVEQECCGISYIPGVRLANIVRHRGYDIGSDATKWCYNSGEGGPA
jgi:hypothetical protein